MLGLALVALASLALGALVARWSFLAFPLVAWPVFYLGLARGWWGSGLGDGWEFAFALATGVSTLAVAVGVGARKLRARGSGSDRAS